MKTSHTTKLFYKKYKYKAVVKTPRTSFIRYAKRSDIESLFNAERMEQWKGIGDLNYAYSSLSLGINDNRHKSHKEIWENRFTLYKLYNWIQKHYVHEVHKIRNEGDKLGFFTNDKVVWENFCGTFKDHLHEMVWPKNKKQEDYFTNNPNNIICQRLPYDKYRFKINLRGRLVRQTGFEEWVENYAGELKASKKLIENSYYSDGRFLYSTDSEMLLLLQMYLGDSIRNTQQYITEAEINEQ